MMPHHVAILAVTLLFTQIVSDSVNKTQLNWEPCPDFTFGDPNDQHAECVIYNAPLCHPGICQTPGWVNPTIEVFVKRFPATTEDPATAANVWLLQGGPGYSSTGLEPTITELHIQLKGQANIYTIDHRGTGRSTRLFCAASETAAARSASGSQMNSSEVSACAKELQSQYGDLSSFSMTSAATDVAAFICKYTNGENTTIYGGSYGTALVERIIHLDPPSVTGYVLDSVATNSGASGDRFPYISLWDTDFGEVGDVFLNLCDKDDSCSRHFSPRNLSSTLQQIITSFDKDPNSTCSQVLSSADVGTDILYGEPPSFSLRRILGLLVADPNLRTLIPPVIYRLDQCGSEDVKILNHLLTSLNEYVNYSDPDNAYKSMLLYYLIVFSEMWETPTRSSQIMEKRFEDTKISDGGFYEVGEGGIYKLNPLYCAFSKEKSATCDEFQIENYDSNAIIYDRDDYWNTSATIPNKASVLLLNGKLDTQTPHKYAVSLLEVLKGTKKELISFDYATHGIIASTPLVDGTTCGVKLLASFVENSGDLSSLDKTCVSEVPAFNWQIPKGYLYKYLATEEAYDGVYNKSLANKN
ncbi:hypothetical protein F443_18612 [Phytophthora nicotianae P1569]|uniref:AB hydrolase-1 domain-containing protein n=1 Tax=Phytophthora nicotianae P1569 TaxID=1317065 RepID=V9E7F0_PHYNI|nr:hypothetical protein F443_18612 [Phytophthora nicotianae P1569]